MSIPRMMSYLRILLLLAAGIAIGCGKSDAPSGDSAPGGLPTVAIGAKKAPVRSADDDEDDDSDPDDEDDKNDKQEIVAPKKGTPEWLVHEATRLLLEPPPKTEDVEVLKKHRKVRNEKIIELSQKAIEQVHGKKDKERLFNAAVHNLMEARLQQALTGDAESIELLYDDAAALFKRDPKSKAAAEGAHTLVNLAYSLAQNSTVDKPRWIKEFSAQAQHFAEEFREEERRSLPLLFAAARSCELAGMTAEALDCYTLLRKGFPKNPIAGKVAPIVKRLNLPGKPPQISGPTFDGDQVSTDDLLGKVVLVVFWSAEVKPFVEQLPRLLAATRPRSKKGLYVLGVNLDLEADTVHQFLVKSKLPWPQIFYQETEKRGWYNPIASEYGLTEIPSLWLIDQSGNVVSTSVKVDELAAEIDKLLGSDAPAAAGASRESKPADSKTSDADSAAEPARNTILERPGQRSLKNRAAPRQ